MVFLWKINHYEGNKLITIQNIIAIPLVSFSTVQGYMKAVDFVTCSIGWLKVLKDIFVPCGTWITWGKNLVGRTRVSIVHIVLHTISQQLPILSQTNFYQIHIKYDKLGSFLIHIDANVHARYHVPTKYHNEIITPFTSLPSFSSTLKNFKGSRLFRKDDFLLW